MIPCCTPATSVIRRALFAICLGSALGAAAFVGGDGHGPAPARATDPALLFPAGSMMMLSIDGGPCSENAKNLALSKIWNEPEVQEFVGESSALLAEMMKQNVKGLAESLGLKPEDLDALMKIKLAFAVTRFQMPEDGSPDDLKLDLMLAADLRGQQKTAEALVRMLEQQMGAGNEGAIKDATIGGVAARTMQLPSGGPFGSVSYLFNDGWMVAGTDPAQIEAALTRAKSGEVAGSLLSDGFFAAGMKEVGRPTTMMSMYLNYGAIVEMVASNPMFEEAVKGTGLDTMKAATFGMDLDGASIRERMYVSVAPNSPLKRLWKPIDVSRLLAHIPKRSILAYGGGVAMKETFDYMADSFLGNAMAKDEFEDVLEEIAKVLGPTWREDLLPNLGPEFAAFASMPVFGLVPDVGVLVKVGDRAKVEAAIAKALAEVSEKGALRSVKFRDATISYVDLGKMDIDREMNMRPAYTFVDDFLLVGLCPNAVKNVLDAIALKDGGLAAREDFAKTFGRLKAQNPDAGNLSIAYVDAQWLVGFALDALIPIAQSAVPARDLAKAERKGIKIDMGNLPLTQTITKHLSAFVMQTQVKEGGTYAEILSPTGVMMPLTVGVAAGMALAVRRVAAFSTEEEEAEAPSMDEDRPRDRAKKAKDVEKDKDEDEDK